ncbi:hypothetical protein MJM43_33460, partial [Salmonella enterica subsp. enterica serovar Montevideo]|nr:hypothetical protein [Salmonella enterica subsp. enterica serovar Montevideo]
DNGVERRLHRRELAYLSADELRSMSDKALGALRLAVADNEHLAIGRTKYNLNIRVSVLKISKSRNDDCPGECNRDVKAQATFR